MGKGTKRRKSPGRHTVHTKDSRYKVPRYPRGSGDLVTREGVTKTQHAWDVDDGMVAEPIYHRPTDEWRGDHNRSDVVDVDYHASKGEPVLDKATIIYANDKSDARSKVEARFGKVKKVEPLGVNHLGNPYFRVTYVSKKKKTRSTKKDSKPIAPPYSKTKAGEKYVLTLESMSKKSRDNETKRAEKLGIRYLTETDRKGGYHFYVHEKDHKLRDKEVVISKPSSETVKRFRKKSGLKGKEEYARIFGLAMCKDNTLGLVYNPREVWDNPRELHAVDFPVYARAEHLKLKDLKGTQHGSYEQLRVGDTFVDAKKFRDAVSILGQDNIVIRTGKKDYPLLIQKENGDSIFLAPLIGMAPQDAKIKSLKNIEGIETST